MRDPRRRLTTTWYLLAMIVALLSAPLLLGCSSGHSAAPQDTTDDLQSLLVQKLTLTPGEARCVIDRASDKLDEATIRQVVDGSADDSSRSDFADAVGDCAFPAAVPGSTLVRTPGQPYSYGDDAELDRLWDECSQTGTDVCDQLFNRAPEGSEYEAFANTCGGRGVRVACAPGSSGTAPSAGQVGNPSPQNYGDDPALDRLWDQCGSGDDQACLALVFQAPPGSGYAAFGQSCGGRGDETCSAAPGP